MSKNDIMQTLPKLMKLYCKEEGNWSEVVEYADTCQLNVEYS